MANFSIGDAYRLLAPAQSGSAYLLVNT